MGKMVYTGDDGELLSLRVYHLVEPKEPTLRYVGPSEIFKGSLWRFVNQVGKEDIEVRLLGRAGERIIANVRHFERVDP